MIFVTSVALAIHIILDFIGDNLQFVFLQFVLILINLAAFILTRYNRLEVAKGLFFIPLFFYITFISFNTEFIEVGGLFYFFPLTLISFLIFRNGQRPIAWIGSFLFTVVFAYSAYSFYIEGVTIQPRNITYPINVIIPFICVLIIFYINKILIKERIVEEQNINSELKGYIDSQDILLHSISHDIKSPLNSIKGLAEIIRNEEDLEVIKGYSKMIEERSNYLTTFLNDLIFLSRNKNTDTINEPFFINELLDEVIENLNYIENYDKINFIKNAGPVEVVSDPLRIKIILNNLISNAIHYNDFRKKDPFVEVSAHISSTELTIIVKDSGLGIPASSRSKIFNRFYRVSTKKDGSGLGLFLVKEVLNKMGGEIKLELGKPTCFRVVIPLSHNG